MIKKSRRRFSAWLGLMIVCMAATSGYDLNERRTNLYKQLSGTKGTGNLLYEVQIVLKTVDDPVPFYTYAWAEYKAGFGNKDGAYYLGNDNIHDLTMSGGYNYTLRVLLTADDGTSLYADYETFAIEGEEDKYRLLLGPYLNRSTLGDSFSPSDGVKFSTSDQDNDPISPTACASLNAGGWWYWGCTYCKLTSAYGEGHDLFHSITWDSWPTRYTYFVYAAMKLKRN